MYKYLFGPVPSRRLGMSLGVDLVPKKVCSLNCVYCEVGATTNLTLARKEYIPIDKVKKELSHYLANRPAPDYITFSGSGEPTLNTGIGDMLHYIRQNWQGISVAVLTNGTLLHDRHVRSALMHADVVLPSLDAASTPVFQKINRPAKGLSVDSHIQGLIDFRGEFKGQIWLELFILPGYNDGDVELAAIKKALLQIRPDAIQLNTLDRPGTIAGLRGATRQELEQLVADWQFPRIDIVSSTQQRRNQQAFRNDIETAIIETISRRPCTLDDLCMILGLHVNETNKYLDVLEAEGKIKTIEQARGVFYQLPEQ